MMLPRDFVPGIYKRDRIQSGDPEVDEFVYIDHVVLIDNGELVEFSWRELHAEHRALTVSRFLAESEQPLTLLQPNSITIDEVPA